MLHFLGAEFSIIHNPIYIGYLMQLCCKLQPDRKIKLLRILHSENNMAGSQVPNHREGIEKTYPPPKCGTVHIDICINFFLIGAFYFHIKAHGYKENHSQS